MRFYKTIDSKKIIHFGGKKTKSFCGKRYKQFCHPIDPSSECCPKCVKIMAQTMGLANVSKEECKKIGISEELATE